MAETREYKCPACGGTVEFDAKLQKMKCPYCDTEFTVDEFEEEIPMEDTSKVYEKTGDEVNVSDDVDWKSSDTGEWDDSEKDKIKVYICQSCGGEIIADENTGATTCPFCGNRVVIKENFSGGLKPDYVIPFKYEKEDAKQAYLKHLEGKKFLPSVFKSENTIDEIKGVYVPFWLFDVDARADVTFVGEKTRSWISSDVEYTETKSYWLERSGSIGFEHIPADGSKKMDDALMESIEPYFFYDAVPFKSAYLAGYMADKYDVDADEKADRVKERIVNSTKRTYAKTAVGYDTVKTQSCQVDISRAKHSYALYPVWILNTTWKGEKYTFAMNGETGKMTGNLPMDKGKFWRFVALKGLGIGAVIYALMWLIILF